jgi:hypothetical protein
MQAVYTASDSDSLDFHFISIFENAMPPLRLRKTAAIIVY